MLPDIIEKPLRYECGDPVPLVGKDWGCTRCLHRSPATEVWHASINSRGRSSWHRHNFCANHFYVGSGDLSIEMEGRQVALRVGEEFTVLPGVWHRFVAHSDVELIETYYLIEGGDMIHGDIERQEVAIEC